MLQMWISCIYQLFNFKGVEYQFVVQKDDDKSIMR